MHIARVHNVGLSLAQTWRDHAGPQATPTET